MPNNGNLKTLGILGGMSWHSSAYYYQTINSEFSERHHENANPRIILDSLCFNNVLDLFKSNDAGQFLDLANKENVRILGGKTLI